MARRTAPPLTVLWRAAADRAAARAHGIDRQARRHGISARDLAALRRIVAKIGDDALLHLVSAVRAYERDRAAVAEQFRTNWIFLAVSWVLRHRAGNPRRSIAQCCRAAANAYNAEIAAMRDDPRYRDFLSTVPNSVTWKMIEDAYEEFGRRKSDRGFKRRFAAWQADNARR